MPASISHEACLLHVRLLIRASDDDLQSNCGTQGNPMLDGSQGAFCKFDRETAASPHTAQLTQPRVLASKCGGSPPLLLARPMQGGPREAHLLKHFRHKSA